MGRRSIVRMFDAITEARPHAFALLMRPLSQCTPQQLVERVAACELVSAAAQAEQLRTIHALAGARAAADAEAGIGPRLAGRTVAAEVAAARGVAPSTARYQVQLAADIIQDHPQLFHLMQQGRVSPAAVRKVTECTAVLQPRWRQEVDANLAAELANRQLTPAELAEAAERQVIGVDPAAALVRCEQERADRRIGLIDKRDGSAAVWTKLKAEEAVSCVDTVDQEARAMRRAGDARSLNQLRCDIFVHRLTSPRAPGLPLQLSETGPSQALATRRTRQRRGRAWLTRRVEIQVVIGASTFMGLDDAPATLRGYGAIPAELARTLADDPAADPVLRRLICDPLDGRLLSMNAQTRCYEGSLRKFVVWRDHRSRFPGSSANIADIDHVLEYARGGRTTAGNGHGLDRGSHVVREHPGVSVQALPVLTGEQLEQLRANAPTIRWQMPTGHCYDSAPPPALGHGSTFAGPPQASVRSTLRDVQAQLRLNRLRRLMEQKRRM